jgi:hypothetical protein
MQKNQMAAAADQQKIENARQEKLDARQAKLDDAAALKSQEQAQETQRIKQLRQMAASQGPDSQQALSELAQVGDPFAEYIGKQNAQNYTAQQDEAASAVQRQEAEAKARALEVEQRYKPVDELGRQVVNATGNQPGTPEYMSEYNKRMAAQERAKRAASVKDKDVSGALRKEFQSNQVYKDTELLSGYAEKVKASSETGPGDISLVFSFMKMVDPGSTVREGEFATAENSGGIPSKIRTQWNSLLRGDRLSPELRGQFRQEAKVLLDTQNMRFESVADQYRRLARQSGANPDDVVLGAVRTAKKDKTDETTQQPPPDTAGQTPPPQSDPQVGAAQSAQPQQAPASVQEPQGYAEPQQSVGPRGQASAGQTVASPAMTTKAVSPDVAISLLRKSKQKYKDAQKMVRQGLISPEQAAEYVAKARGQ